MGVKLQQRVFESIPMGEYPATVTAVTATEGKYGPELQFDFVLNNPTRTELRAWTGTTLSSKSKLGRWVQAILGGLPKTLDTDELLGKQCTLVVLVKPRGSDGEVYNRVNDVLPAIISRSVR